MAIGGFLGGLAGAGGVLRGANEGALLEALARQRQLQAQQAAQQAQQEQQLQQYLPQIWQAGLQAGQQPTGGQQDAMSAGNQYGLPPVQSYPLAGTSPPNQLAGTSPPLPQAPQGMAGSFPSPTMGGGQMPQYAGGGGGMASGLSQVPPSLKAEVLQAEGSRPGQIGAAGEEGEMQVLPSTEQAMGYPKGTALYSDAPGDAYLAKLYRESGGNRAATLAGYNRGEGGMRQFERGGLGAMNPPPAPAYQRVIQQEIAKKGQKVAQVAGPEAANTATKGAQEALQLIDPAMYGRAQAAHLMEVIEKTMPEAPAFVKFSAVSMLSKIMNPLDQQIFKLQMQQNQDLFRLALQQRSTDAADERLTRHEAGADERLTKREAASDERQTRTLQAQAERQDKSLAAQAERQQRALAARSEATRQIQAIHTSQQSDQKKAAAIKDLYNQKAADVRNYRTTHQTATPETDPDLMSLIIERDELEVEVARAGGFPVVNPKPAEPPGGKSAALPPS